MYDNLTLNGEPFVSMYGEIICDEYLPENTIMNPESSFGWFIYMIIGGGFDKMDEMSSNFLNDLDVVSANPDKLDKFYGVAYNLPRPKIIDDGEERLLTDREYRVYLYLRNCQLLTRLDLLSVFGHCMGDDTSDLQYNGVTVTDEINGQWHAVDHLHYNSSETESSNIGRSELGDHNHIVNHMSTDDEVYRIPDKFSYSGKYITYVNVPSAGWSGAFLDFLVDYISIKGNVLIREVVL